MNTAKPMDRLSTAKALKERILLDEMYSMNHVEEVVNELNFIARTSIINDYVKTEIATIEKHNRLQKSPDTHTPINEDELKKMGNLSKISEIYSASLEVGFSSPEGEPGQAFIIVRDENDQAVATLIRTSSNGFKSFKCVYHAN